MMSDFEVVMGDMDSAKDFYVKFFGPKDSTISEDCCHLQV